MNYVYMQMFCGSLPSGNAAKCTPKVKEEMFSYLEETSVTDLLTAGWTPLAQLHQELESLKSIIMHICPPPQNI